MTVIIICIPIFIGACFLAIDHLFGAVNKKLIKQGNTTFATLAENQKTDLRDVRTEISGTRGHVGGKTYFPVLKYEVNGITYIQKGVWVIHALNIMGASY